MALVAIRCESLAERFEAIANYELSTDKEQADAAKRENDVRAAIKSSDYNLIFLNGGAVLIQFGTGRDRWHWAFEDGELVRDMSADDFNLLEKRLRESQRQLQAEQRDKLG